MLTKVSTIQFLCRIYEPPEYGFIAFGAHGDPIVSSCGAPEFFSTSIFSVLVPSLSMHPENAITPKIVTNAIHVPIVFNFIFIILITSYY